MQLPGFEDVKRHIAAYIDTEEELKPGYFIYQKIIPKRMFKSNNLAANEPVQIHSIGINQQRK